MVDSSQTNDHLDKMRQQSFERALERIKQVESSKRKTLSLADLHYLDRVPTEVARLTWLTTLILPYGPYSDLSPLEHLTKLETLEARTFRGKTLSFLRHLNALTFLRTGSSTVDDISALANLKRLKHLFLDCSESTDLSVLSQPKELEELNLHGGNGELAPLEHLSQIQTLSLSSSKLSTLDIVSRLKQLSALSIYGNSVPDYSRIGRIVGLTSLDLMLTAPAPDMTWIVELQHLKSLRLYSGTSVTLDAIKELTGLKTLQLYLPMQDLSPLAGLTNLLNLDITATGARDLTPLAQLVGLVVGAELNRVSGGLAYSSKEISDTAIRSIGNVGRLQRTRRVLDRIRRLQGLSPLDEALRDWSASAATTEANWQDVLANTKTSPIGVKFIQHDEQLAIDPSGDLTDQEAAENALTRQLHEGVTRRSKEFVPLAVRVNNQPAWQGIGETAKRFAIAVDSPTADIPGKIGHVYDAIVELGSYLELDQTLRTSADANGHPLEPEIYRALSDLIRSAAPWVRRFPTAQALDSESGAFLTRAELYNPATTVADLAEDAQLISSDDASVLRQLVEAAHRGQFQGQKAGNRVTASARNLILTAGTLATSFYFSAISSDFATKSKLVMRAGTFLSTSEESVMQLFSDSPADVRHALRALIDDLRKQNQDPRIPNTQYLVSAGPRLRDDDDEDEDKLR